ncbi:uncharacterized protein UV8b_05761 [Ustilaginoidea virens]|uniref:Uncharacterized protein n=1 Tax=Ustilaginoidea virens TaxID=1159556 RepID=A0A8E5HUE3_USTVR|nr:uncharacterized protein UV8b_05761 [Ustilaginoidea virens]QUC21518.1 hypothetical protein UV8b_05761 [Ustilaginoidea virens]
MKLSTSLGASLYAAIATASFTNSQKIQPREYDFSDVSGAMWQGEIHPGEKLTLRGTVQDISKSIRSLSPSSEGHNYTASAPEADNEKRYVWVERNIDCNYGDWADRSTTWRGITYLRESYNGKMQCTARPGFGPGRGTCSRVSCDNGVGIWFCNDNLYEYIVPCSVIADVADRLISQCFEPDGDVVKVRGQIFSVDDWNVIVRSTSCG